MVPKDAQCCFDDAMMFETAGTSGAKRTDHEAIISLRLLLVSEHHISIANPQWRCHLS
jgi:hypothetical protein